MFLNFLYKGFLFFLDISQILADVVQGTVVATALRWLIRTAGVSSEKRAQKEREEQYGVHAVDNKDAFFTTDISVNGRYHHRSCDAI